MTDEPVNPVDAALRRWRTSAVPLENQEFAGDRRARTLGTIASAMRQGQFDRQRARRGRLWAAGLVAAGMLVGLGSWTLSTSTSSAVGVTEETATLSSESGMTWLWSGADKQPIESGAERSLKVGDRILTESGRAQLKVGADTRIAVAEQSEVVLSQNRKELRSVTLRGGAIDVDVEPRRDGRVEIETPHARIVVHGTEFSVAVSEPDEESASTSVSVRRGVVAVIRSGREVARLRAGERWNSKKPEAKPVAVAPTAQERAREAARVSEPGLKRIAKRQAAPSKAKVSSVVEVDSSTLAEQNQLFRRAVDARNQGDDERAIKGFDALLAKYPNSALAQEARVERFRALKRLGRNREAASAARRYLMDHTNGFAKDEARGIALTPGSTESAPK